MEPYVKLSNGKRQAFDGKLKVQAVALAKERKRVV